MQAELDRPLPEPQWHHFRSVHEMSAREYSLWCDAGKPPLMPNYTPPPPPPPAPPKPPGLRLDQAFAERLGDVQGRLILRERERLAGELAARDLRLERLEARLQALESALISKGLQSVEQLALPAPRGNGVFDA